MKLKIMNYCYYKNESSIDEYNAPVLIFLCRDINHKFHMVYICDKDKLAPEMYIPLEERFVAENLDLVTKIEEALPSNYGESVLRLETNFPNDIGYKLKQEFSHTYLSDIKWEKMCVQKIGLETPYIEVPDDYAERWLKVSDIKQLPHEEEFYVPIRWVAWDIETNYERTFPVFVGWEDAETNDIISISAYDSYTKEYHVFFWHKNVETNNTFLWKNWERKGDYYVPAIKKLKNYDNTNKVYVHAFTNEKDMLKEYFNWFADVRPDAQYGFNSEGGYRISTKKGKSRKYWFNGYDMPYLYHRCRTLKLLDEIKKMSPLPKIVKGVKWRNNGGRVSVQIEGVCQIDFIFTADIFGYHKKHDEFREGNLQGFMSFFLGFGKVFHEEQIFEMWRDNIESDYDPSNPNLVGVNKGRNYVMELFDEAKCTQK